MKKGFSIWGIVAGVVVVVLIAIASFLVIDGNNKATDYSKYDFFSVIEATDNNGGIADHVKGDPSAPVIIFEYADFQCPLCATINPRVNKVIENSDGNLAVVHRNYLLPYHGNATAAASAAEAAGLQGLWKEYADELFANQAEWEYAKPSERTELFNKYFEKVAGDKGDLDKFNRDLASPEVSKKISFDMGLGKRTDVPGTPAFYVDGQFIDFGNEDGGQLIINGEKISWEGQQVGDDFEKLLEKIVDAKLAEK